MKILEAIKVLQIFMQKYALKISKLHQIPVENKGNTKLDKKIKPKIAFLFVIISSVLIVNLSCFAEIRVFFSPNGGIAEEIIKQIDNAKEYI